MNPTVNALFAARQKTLARITPKNVDQRQRMKKLLSHSASLAQGSTNSTPISIITRGLAVTKELSEIRRGLDNTAIFHSIRKILGKEYWYLGQPCWRINGLLVTLWFPKIAMTKVYDPVLKFYYGSGYPIENKYAFKYLCRSFIAHTEAAREACHYAKRYGRIP